MGISSTVDELLKYAIQKELIDETEEIWARNSLMGAIGCDEYDGAGAKNAKERPLEEILEELCDYAFSQNLIKENDITHRDIFDTHIMGILTNRPSIVTSKFNSLYKKSPEDATDWFYDFSCNTNYIRRDRIKKDRKWTVDCEYGTLDITINLSKPEKDPKAIAAAKKAKQSGYPKCLLCMENEGYSGRINHPARQNHRIIPITVNDKPWGFQYSPYVYYNEHCIVFNSEHIPMKIDRDAFCKLFSFVEQFPHYFLGSNADLPIVGGSILTHDHFQGGHYTFAMERASIEYEFTVSGFEDIKAGIVKWPLSVIRLRGSNKERIIDLSTYILEKWRGYTDEEAFIYAFSDNEPHNTITPIVRMRDGQYEIDLTLRNNITTKEHPLGLYHPHSQYHHIKKENIGLIEVMGLAVLPARLNHEMDLLAECIEKDLPIDSYEELEKHMDWINEWKGKTLGKSREEIVNIIEQEIGKVFTKVLEDAGVYKCTKEGRTAFKRFINSL